MRELQPVSGSVDLRYVLIAKIPFVISDIILQYLPRHQLFEAQRVSSQWKQILLSPQRGELLLRDWFPKSDEDLGLRIPKGLSSQSITKQNTWTLTVPNTHSLTRDRHGVAVLRIYSRGTCRRYYGLCRPRSPPCSQIVEFQHRTSIVTPTTEWTPD